MKQLLLLRHAKSSWAQPGLDDESRPLNKRGVAQCVALNAWCSRERVEIDLALVSTARRTRETWERIEDGLVYGQVEIDASLYNGDIDTYLSALYGQTEDRVMIVGHNPTCDELSRYLATPSDETEKLLERHFGTATLAWLVFDVAEWSQIGQASGRLQKVLRPGDLAVEAS